jgi:hypothetical protein
MEILSFGVGARIEICAATLQGMIFSSDIGVRRLIILPIPTTRDGAYITGTEIELSALLDLLDEETFMAGYGIPRWLREAVISRGGAVYDSGEDETFLLENAKITAHGALGRMLTETGRDVSELTVGIIGYGRIGSALAELLLFLGAGVRIYSENREKITMLAEAGALVEELSAGADFSGLDIIINTAPETLIPEETVGKLIDGGTHLIELASGKNYSDERVVRMASIPDKMYPLSAGRLYARSIARAIRQRKNGG